MLKFSGHPRQTSFHKRVLSNSNSPAIASTNLSDPEVQARWQAPDIAPQRNDTRPRCHNFQSLYFHMSHKMSLFSSVCPTERERESTLKTVQGRNMLFAGTNGPAGMQTFCGKKAAAATTAATLRTSLRWNCVVYVTTNIFLCSCHSEQQFAGGNRHAEHVISSLRRTRLFSVMSSAEFTSKWPFYQMSFNQFNHTWISRDWMRHNESIWLICHKIFRLYSASSCCCCHHLSKRIQSASFPREFPLHSLWFDFFY